MSLIFLFSYGNISVNTCVTYDIAIVICIIKSFIYFQMDFKNALFHFSQLLTNMPTYWTALARLIEVMRRSAKIEEADIFIRRGEQNCQRPNEEAGRHFRSMTVLIEFLN